MSSKSDHTSELELQLVVVEPTHETDNDNIMPIDLISQYRILDKKCDEILKKIYHRRTVKKN
jgi:hypothetical protein